MVPKLLRGTMTSTNCKALGSLAEVAGPAISPHLSNIFPPLLRLASQPGSSSSAAPAAKDALIKVQLSKRPTCIPNDGAIKPYYYTLQVVLVPGALLLLCPNAEGCSKKHEHDKQHKH